MSLGIKCIGPNGTEYNSVTHLCNHYNINASRICTLIGRGYTAAEAVSKLIESRNKKEVVDHTGKGFKNKTIMLKHWGVSLRAFNRRIAKGCSLEEALITVEKTCVVDHLGNEFETLNEMYKHWSTTATTYIRRIKSGLSVEDALTTKVGEIPHRGNRVTDHLGNNFNSVEEMCKHWGITRSTYFYRLKHGKSLKYALTFKTKSSVCDHLGNKYKSVKSMCEYWGINVGAYFYRIRKGFTVEEAIEYCVNNINNKVLDHLGNEFNSVKELCRTYGIGIDAYRYRVAQNWKLEDILTTKVNQITEVIDHLGNKHKSKRNMCEHFGVSYTMYIYRIDSGWSIQDALTIAPMYTKYEVNDSMGNNFESRGTMCEQYHIKHDTFKKRRVSGIGLPEALIAKNTDSIKLEFIGINRKAYYKVAWSKNLVTAREVVEYTRPDLLDAYDKYNPTGEYEPYKREV